MMSEIPLPFPVPGPLGLIRTVSSYSLLLLAAFVAAAYLAPRELSRRGLRPQMAEWSLIVCIVAALVGARVGYLFEVWDRIWIVNTSIPDTIEHLLAFREGMGTEIPGALGFWEALFTGGLVFHWGFVFAVLAMALHLRRNRVNVLRYADTYLMLLALGYGIGRLGCWVSGDGCYGYAASINIPLLTWVFDDTSQMSTEGVRVWNTPLIEAIFSWALFAWMMLRGRFLSYRPGFLSAVFLVYDGLVRTGVEFLRINDALIPVLPHPELNGKILAHHTHGIGPPDAAYFQHWHWYGITEAQIFGLLVAMAGAIWIWKNRLYRREEASRGFTDPQAAESAD